MHDGTGVWVLGAYIRSHDSHPSRPLMEGFVGSTKKRYVSVEVILCTFCFPLFQIGLILE